MLMEKEWDEIMNSEPMEIDPDYPAIPVALSVALYERCLPIKPALAKYTQLVYNSGQVLDFDTDKLSAYEADLKIAAYSDGIITAMSALGLEMAIRDVKDRDKYDAAYLARRLYGWLEMASDHAMLILDFGESREEEERQRDELKRLKADEVYLNEQIAYWSQEIAAYEAKQNEEGDDV